MKLDHIPVARKLWGATFLIVLGLVLAAFASQHFSDAALRQALERVERADGRIELATRWKGLTEAAATIVLSKALSAEPMVSDTLTPRYKEIVATITELQQGIRKEADTPPEQAALETTAQARKTVHAITQRVDDARKAGDGSAAIALVQQQLVPATSRYLQSLDEFVAVQRTLRDAAKVEALAQAQRVKYTGWTVVAAVSALGLVALGRLLSSITRPLAEVVAVAQAIATGDLTRRPPPTRRGDEIGRLMQAMAGMSQHLNALVAQVREGVGSVQSAASEIAQGNQDLSSRTEQAAASLQQSSSALEHLTGTVSQSADTARQANQLATAAASSAREGGESVAQVVANMERISEGSRRIADIIGVIDGIAFQTNILALNAAVEAARAGEQGRGFAVVAGEVRNLAQRSAEAAKEIKGLIHASVETVEAGSAQVTRTGSAMNEIVSSVQRVSDLIGEIAAAAGEQRDGIGQVNQAVGGLDQMTQQNAALVEESAAAAQSLRQQAERLAQVVAVFKVDDRQAALAAG